MKLVTENNINKLCLRCLNQCKQSAASKIIKCPMFEKKENDFKSDLKSEISKGCKNVSPASERVSGSSKTSLKMKIGE